MNWKGCETKRWKPKCKVLFAGGTDKNHENPQVRIAGLRAEILTRNLLNRKQARFNAVVCGMVGGGAHTTGSTIVGLTGYIYIYIYIWICGDFGPYGIIFRLMNVRCYNCCHGNAIKGFWASCLLSICWLVISFAVKGILGLVRDTWRPLPL
jgi:hypothetical protein